MAEGSEGGGKASDLYLGVVDLFAVILPGALFCGLAWKVLHGNDQGWELLEGISGPEFVPKWLAFLIVSYIVGHFLFALGAWMMDRLYDGYYKRHFEFEVKKELPSMRRRADHLFHKIFGTDLYSEGDNRLTWSESLLTVGGAAAKGTLDRLEADSKFFRSLAVVAVLSMEMLFSPLTGWISDKQWLWTAGTTVGFVLLLWIEKKSLAPKASFDRRVKLRLLGFPKHDPPDDALPSRFSWTDAEWLKAEAVENKESAARFWWFAAMIPIAWTLLATVMIAMARDPKAILPGVACWLLALGSAWRYMEIRAKRLLQAYYFVIAANKSSVFNSAPPEKKP